MKCLGTDEVFGNPVPNRFTCGPPSRRCGAFGVFLPDSDRFDARQRGCWGNQPQTLHGTAIYAYISPPNHPNVGIYGSPISRVWELFDQHVHFTMP